MQATKKNTLWLVAVIIVAAGIGILYARNILWGTPQLDTRMHTALLGVQALTTYEMEVETSATVSLRPLAILGRYQLDFKNDRFGSFTTTTLMVPGEDEKLYAHTFTLQNISTGNDIYVKIETESPLLKKTIPHSPVWQHLNRSAIPSLFKDIAVEGPMLNTLALFANSGSYIRLVEKPFSYQVDGATFYRYRFELSELAKDVSGGTLKSLIDRIGRGTVDVWIDESPAIRFVVVRGESYVSTSSILRINTPVDIPTPSTQK